MVYIVIRLPPFYSVHLSGKSKKAKGIRRMEGSFTVSILFKRVLVSFRDRNGKREWFKQVEPGSDKRRMASGWRV